MKVKKVLFAFLLTFLVFVFFSVLPGKSNVSALEGIFEIRSTNQEDYRCFVASLLMPNTRYRLLVGCVDLLYPPGPPDLYSYVMWARPITGRNPIKLGELGVGKQQFEVRQPFDTLFVTIEPNAGIRSPSNYIVMSGNVQTIEFLERPTTPTPTPGEALEEEVEETPTEELTTRQKLFLALRRAGLAALFALIAIIGLIFVVTRSRG